MESNLGSDLVIEQSRLNGKTRECVASGVKNEFSVMMNVNLTIFYYGGCCTYRGSVEMKSLWR